MIATSSKHTSSCVLVTGGSGVIGQAISQEFGQHRWHVGVQYCLNHRSATETLGYIQASGGTATIYQTNIQDPKQIHRMVDQYRQKHLHLDVLIWAIGIADSRLLVRTTPESWATHVTTNLTGCFRLLQAVAPIFEDQQSGSVILVGSHSAIQGTTGQSAYASSKAGLIGLMKSVAKEWAPWNIRINTIFPGWHRSALSGESFPHPDGLDSHVLKTTPTITDVATATYQLATMEGISGQVWNLDSRIT